MQLHFAMAMAMAMATPMATASALLHSSTIPSHSPPLDSPAPGTSSKCSPRNKFLPSENDFSTLNRGHTSSPRSSLRSSARRSWDCGETSGENGLRESESRSREFCEGECGLESSSWRRRECFLAFAVAGALASQERARAEESEVSVDAPPAVDAPALELYVDEKEGFKLLRPALWNKVEKAGATVLFEDPAKRGNTIGVVVNPVRIASLKDFGTPDVVAEKLLAAERKKPSTNDAQLVRVQERLANGDTPLYSLEYTLDSSRGQKKILSAVTVASKKLYILNITYVDSAAAPAPPAMAEAYEQILNSFDLVV